MTERAEPAAPAGSPGDPRSLRSDLRRVLSSSGAYALAALAQQGVSFLLLPLYTRFVTPVDYGKLELLNAFSAVAFACLVLGLPSAIAKCYHRDCDTAGERASLLPTSLALGLPGPALGGVLLCLFAATASRWLLGDPAGGELVRLMAAAGVLSSGVAIVLASLRAAERAVAYGWLTLAQVTTALLVNILLVVHYGLGIRGILWGNLASQAVALACGIWIAHRGGPIALSRRLTRPLLHFGLMLLPVLLASWVMDLSDRYVLRLYAPLSAVAVYAVGYKIGMVLQVAVVWPFQLAWPAVSFSISHRPGHRHTYSRALTWLVAAMAFCLVALTLISRVALPFLVGAAYREAYRVVPVVALAYALNGIHYCVSPGVHLAGRTRWFPALAIASGALNLGLNFLLIPRLGIQGAAWSTAAAFALFAAGTFVLAQRFYPIAYEYDQLAKVLAATVLILFLGTRVPPGSSAFALAWHLTLGLAGLPALLLATGFFRRGRELEL